MDSKIFHRLLLLTILAVAIGTLLSFLFPSTPVAHAAENESEIVIQIRIPGITFECSKQQGKMCVRSLGEYISGFYRFFAGALGIIAAVMVMWGGIKWMTAGGNASKVKDAKDTIYSAVIALLITLGSYLLLFTVNPQLVSLQLPNINSVARIDQGSIKCSENTFSKIDRRTGCDPERQECCGKKMKVDLGGGKLGECEWDICNKRDEICFLASDPGVEGGPGCIQIESKTMENKDEGQCCAVVDSMMRNAKTNDGSQKFQYTGKGFKRASWEFGPFGAENFCIWGVTFQQYFQLYPTLPSDLADDFQPQFISCYTQGAKGVCWDDVDGKPQPLDCEGHKATPCKDPTSVPRPITGAAGACLVKIGRTGSPDKKDYTCWSVPEKDPRKEAPNGWGSPPSY